jgi:hypothetical protein
LSDCDALIKRIEECPPGRSGWREYEDACVALLSYLFVPPLQEPKIQARSYSGIDRRDAVFPNREFDISTTWGKLQIELGARLVLVEFKNYDETEVGKDEVNQTHSYLRHPWGRLALVCSSKEPAPSAYTKRNTLYSEHGVVILFLMLDHLREMCEAKERGDDPADLIADLVEEFYLQYE